MLLFCAAIHAFGAELPGATIDAALGERLAVALREKGEGYRPRTEHLNANGTPKYSNRLLLENSPYLIQHAHNPVNWFPWGDEAFAKARREDKPIFLSIGYSTCHWCHVMEKESFDNVEIARLLNENFVAIKVDRERRPDIDNTYMTAIRLFSDHGGWPMSSFLTVDGKTFWGGSYFPPKIFSQLLSEVDKSWHERRVDIEAQAVQVAKGVNELTQNRVAAKAVDGTVIRQAVDELRLRRDKKAGGFGSAPKFPQASIYLFLIDYGLRNGDPDIASWVKFDLDAISNGGIRDHIGGGFHRYSTDARWRIPHFEKMLYNQAQLLRVYAHAYQWLGDERYADVVADIVAFLDREMTAPAGGFYSALDADSGAGEGEYYVWTRDELESVLEPYLASMAIDWFNVSKGGNFDGANVLFLSKSAAELAQKYHLSRAEWDKRIASIRKILSGIRDTRTRPLRDDKIVTAWNGMMITALAEASVIFARPAYLERAIAGADFLLRTNRAGDGGLWRSTYNGIGSVPAVAADYAAFGEALIALYDATRDVVWLDRAKALAQTLHDDYWDPEHGGYFMSRSTNDVASMSRPKAFEDGAVPSGNAMALRMLAGLNARTADLALEAQADKLIAALAGVLRESPGAHTYALWADEIFRRGGQGPIRYAARGAVRISTHSDNDVVAITLDVKPGWHIQAHQPLQPDLIGTAITLPGPEADGRRLELTYPPARIKSLSFRGESLALYEGEVRIEARLFSGNRPGTRRLPLQLTLQACDDRSCLPPERIAIVARIDQK